MILLETQGLILSFMTCRSNELEKRAVLSRMGKGFCSRMVLRCLMKKLVIAIWLCAVSLQIFWAEGKSLPM